MKTIFKHIKNYLPCFLTLLVLAAQTSCARFISYNPIRITYNSLEDIVAQMTLEEKIGQMTQAEIGDLQIGDVTTYALGSVLNGGHSSPQQNTPQGWFNMIKGFTEESLKTRLGIPIIYGLDAVHGHNNAMNAVILPHNIGLGAIAAGDLRRGMDSAYTAGRVTAQEMLATGVRWTFAPVLGVAEDVRWGRTYECYSENVEIVTALGERAVSGLQDGGVAVCIKHFLGEGQTTDGNQGNAILDRAGIERIIPPYRAAIDSGAMAVMASFSSVNGIKMHENRELLTGLLKEEMGFKGMVVSDWAALGQLSGGSFKAQIANAINAGIDMVMATNGRAYWMYFIKLLKELVEEGTVPMSRIDDAVLRILRFKQAAGLFKTPPPRKPGVIGTDANRAAARAIVSDSLVLLRNENNIIANLPSYKNILIAGQGANDIGMQCGGWTISWQGSHGSITEGTTILEGIQAAVKGKAAVTYAVDGRTEGTFDAVIAVIGESPYAETQGDRFNSTNILGMEMDPDRLGTADISEKIIGRSFNGINISQRDVDMLFEVYEYGCPVIVIMLSGRPMTIDDDYENWNAFIAAWLPGTEGGGIADVLFGERDFTGRTPYTWRKTNGEVLYPFGFGLGKGERNETGDFTYETKNSGVTITGYAGDFIYSTENGGIIITGYAGSERNIVIPPTINGLPVTAVGKNAFTRKRLTSVTLPGTVTVVGDRAFSYNRLTELTLPGSVTTVEYGAFSNNRLSNINLSNSLTSIGIYAFAGNRLRNINLPDSLEHIGHMAFSNNLFTNVTIPNNVRNFNSGAFDAYVKIMWR
jgi:beta-glucosidase